MKIEDTSQFAARAEPVPAIAGVAAFSAAPVAGDAADHRSSVYVGGLKRVADVAFAILSALVWVPLTLGLALLVMRDGHNPFYAQKRIGQNGRVYRMWKLRSMVPDADAALAEILARDPAARAEWDEHQKLRDDPRITRIGRFIRAFSLDELPQFWNVLIGDMSVVGPRPMMVDQAPLYPGRAYYALRPGITGPWQVSARNDCGFADRARFDEEYERTLSFGTDLTLIVATIFVVLRGTGL